MKRWTFRILLCLFLGVVTTVGVAWGCSLTSRLEHGNLVVPTEQELYAFNTGDRTASLTDIAVVHATGFGDMLIFYYDESGLQDAVIDARVRREGRVVSPPTRLTYGLIQQSGWPFRAVVSSYWWHGADWSLVEPENGDFNGHEGIFWGIFATKLAGEIITGEKTMLALRPILPGFIINTLFYAVIWFGLFFNIGQARRAIRRKHGRCVMCGYNIRSDFKSGCPECGWNRKYTE